MGNLGEDTAVIGGDGRWTARFSADWEIWGPNGGYVASVALRAAGAHSAFRRPASLLCHYLGVAAFDTVDITTTTLRLAKRAESVRVTITQQEKPIAEALVWCVDEGLDGLDHDAAVGPDVPAPDALPDLATLMAGDGGGASRPSFARNFEQRPINWRPWAEWENRVDLDPSVVTWMRYRPQPTFDDQFVDAARSVILLDTWQWPAACNAYRPGTMQYQAPSLDLAVSFHEIDPTSEWLLVDARSPVARDGLVGGQAAIWSQSGKLLASGGQQMLCRPFRTPAPR